MTKTIEIDAFLARSHDAVVVDVRSPAEFAQGHIPGAINIWLFTDQQRSDIGTLYKEAGRNAAVLRGFDFVGPRMREIVEAAGEASGGRELLLHCWRGGMRSASVAWLLEQAGLGVQVLRGGYKQYRRRAQQAFGMPRRMVVLSGMTGAGKTDCLHRLAEHGEQVLDLEGLAHHRGSAFGAIGLPPQPTCEQFENRVFARLQETDTRRVLWVEDESPSIGRVRVPETLWREMRNSPALFLDVSRQQRARALAQTYGSLDRAALEASITRIARKLGGLRAKQALQSLAEGALESVAFDLLAYYDKTYQHAAQRRPRQCVVPVAAPVSLDGLRETAERALLQFDELQLVDTERT